MRAHVVVGQVMRIVGNHERNIRLGCQAADLRHQDFVLVETVILHFEKEVIAAEDVRVFVSESFRLVVLVVDDGFVDVAAQAGRHGDQSFGVPRQQILIYTRFVVEAIEIAGRDKVDEVLVAFLRFAEQNQVVIAVGIGAGLVALLRDVNFATDDRVNTLRRRFVIKLHGAEEVAMVGHGHRRHVLPFHLRHQLFNVTGSVEEGVIGVAMEMDEGAFWHAGQNQFNGNRFARLPVLEPSS